MAMTKETRKQYLQCLLMGRSLPLSAADETDIVAVAMTFGEEIQKHGNPAMAIYALRQQLAEAKKDAERYRWLRDNDDALAALGMIDESALDEYIDQAIKEGE